jgi:16S rRNA (guanine527-N7)-methyltransferase
MTTSPDKAPSTETIRRALGEFQITVNDTQVVYIQRYIRMLLHWNDKLNLTAIREPLEILYRHFCESMYAGPAVPIDKGRIADIGSGPGFPGLPLKILNPDLELILVESNIKKGTFLAELVRELELEGARVLISRYEELGEELAPVDFILSRALGEFPSFLEWAASDVVSAHGVALWIGGRDLEEVQKSTLWQWREPIPVPNSLRRYLLVGSKTEQLSA